MYKMKSPLLIVALFFPLSIYAQENNDPWFSVKDLAPQTWLIDDHGADNMYLIEGSDSALLVDTGLGVADLISVVKKITNKPLIVVNTHGHPDHAGSDYQFDKIYMNAGDTAAARQFNDPASRSRVEGQMLNGAAPAEDELYKGEEKNFRFGLVSDGYTFDLGGRHVRVVDTPGHTPGSICLLDLEHEFLFTGDSNNKLVWAFLPGGPPLHIFLASLEKQKELFPEFTKIFPGHGPPVPNDFINDEIECMRSILEKTCEPKPYETFVGKAQLCTSGRASVAYDPDNL